MSSLLNFISFIKTNVNSSLISTKLTLDEINYINTLLQEEYNYLEKLEKLEKLDNSNKSRIISKILNEFNNIIKDGMINLHDIPEIILLITDILKTNIIQNNVQNIEIINIIKFILDSLFESNILLLNSSEINIVNSLIDSSLQLLKTNIDFVVKEEEEEKEFCSFLQGIHFGYCSHWSFMDMKKSYN